MAIARPIYYGKWAAKRRRIILEYSSIVEAYKGIKACILYFKYITLYVVEARTGLSLTIMSKKFCIWLYHLLLRVIEDSLIGF